MPTDRPAHGGYPNPREINIEVKPAEFMPADQVLIVQPGDTLILRYTRPIDAATAAAVKARIAERLPQLRDVLAINCEQLAVYRPPAQEAPTPPYVHRLLTAFLDQTALDFGALDVPKDVQERLRAAYQDGTLGGVPVD